MSSNFRLSSGNGSGRAEMTPERMISIAEAMCDSLTAEGNVVELSYQSIAMVLLYDLTVDRMRIVSPIVEVEDLEPGQLEAAMVANYHTALDARYAISNGIVWAAFIHPLSDLSERLLKSAIHQVAMARATFGDHYTSGELVFSDGTEEGGDEN